MGKLSLIVDPFSVPDVVAEFLVRRLCGELGLRGLQTRRVVHNGCNGLRYGSELIKSCQLIRAVRSSTFATNLRVTAVYHLLAGVRPEAIRHTTFLTQFARYMVNRVHKYNF